MLDHFDLIACIYDRLIGPPNTERLQKLLKLPIDGWLLDAGGGTGRVSSHLNGMIGHIVVSDLSHRMLKKSLNKKVSPVRVRFSLSNYPPIQPRA